MQIPTCKPPGFSTLIPTCKPLGFSICYVHVDITMDKVPRQVATQEFLQPSMVGRLNQSAESQAHDIIPSVDKAIIPSVSAKVNRSFVKKK